VNPRFNTVTVQNGIDIAAPAGTPVRAVAPGRVVHSGWFKGYGNLVIVDHGDGFHTLVAHLASMRTAMGEEVGSGSVLGTVGDSGSMKGAYLYFEIRERGQPVDPRPWLAP
jgi:septal ring factor EnvC (AmiA/AmiB activator)